jgi:hypothetical protein
MYSGSRKLPLVLFGIIAFTLVFAHEVILYTKGSMAAGEKKHEEMDAAKFGKMSFACETPASVSISSIDQTTALVHFISSGNNFIVEYGATGFIPGTGATAGGGIIATGVSSPIALSGLAAGTSYEVYVRNVCIAGEYSANTSVSSFKTLCNAGTLPYFENFDGVAAPALPSCINIENSNGGNSWRTVGTDFTVSSPNLMRLDYEIDNTTAADDWFFTQGLNLTAGIPYRVTFQYRSSDGPVYVEKLQVRYGLAPNAASMTAGTLFTNNNIDFQTWAEGGTDFTPAASGLYYIGFHGMSDAGQAYLAIDDVKVEGVPSCPPPIGVTVSNISSTQASVNFTLSGVNYIVEYGPHGFVPGTGASAGIGGTVVSTNVSPVIITGLTTLTQYDVYVRQVCDGPFYGPNSGKYTFTTILGNDEAPGAVTVTLGSGCTGEPYSNAGATQSANEPYASCSGTTGYATVWFKFTAPASGAVRVSTANGSGSNTLTDSRVALFSAGNVNDYSTFNIISCDDDNGSAPHNQMSVLYATGLTTGATYYVQVDAQDDALNAGTFCLTVDDMDISMLSTSTDCIPGQAPVGVSSYTGWVSLVDANSNLIAMVRNTAGGAVSGYSVAQNINTIPMRHDGTAAQRYFLNRNYHITNTASVNAEVKFFFRNDELASLQTVDAGVTLANLGATRQAETVPGCHSDFSVANGVSAYAVQTGNGTVNGISWIQTTTGGSFSNFYLHTAKAPVNVKAFLQGAYNTTLGRHKNITAAWASAVNTGAINQPYNVAPFNYAGTEHVSPGFFTVSSLPTAPLDWVLVEIRNASNVMIKQRAALILLNGEIVDVDGVSPLSFRDVAGGNYFIRVRHRNHLGVRSSVTMVVDGALGADGAPALYDFSSAQSTAMQTGTITTNAALGQMGSAFVMWGGNANGDDFIRMVQQVIPSIPSDAAYILGAILSGVPSGTFTGYSVGDVNMDGFVRMTQQVIPSIPSDAGFILGAPLSGVPNATRREHK